MISRASWSCLSISEMTNGSDHALDWVLYQAWDSEEVQNNSVVVISAIPVNVQGYGAASIKSSTIY